MVDSFSNIKDMISPKQSGVNNDTKELARMSELDGSIIWKKWRLGSYTCLWKDQRPRWLDHPCSLMTRFLVVELKLIHPGIIWCWSHCLAGHLQIEGKKKKKIEEVNLTQKVHSERKNFMKIPMFWDDSCWKICCHHLVCLFKIKKRTENTESQHANAAVIRVSK